MTSRTLLQSAGQPLRRTRAWTYCVNRSGSAGAAAVLTPEGTVALVASSAPRHRARGIWPGTKLAKLRGQAKRIGGGIWIKPIGKKKRVAYLVRKKLVRTVAVAGPAAHGLKALRAYLNLVPSAGMKARRAVAARRTAASITEQNATPLVQQNDPLRYELFCNIGL